MTYSVACGIMQVLNNNHNSIERNIGKHLVFLFNCIAMNNIEILDAVVGANESGRCKTVVGFFVEEGTDKDDAKVLDEYFVTKPIIEFAEFSDDEENEYYSVAFNYKSARDEDFRLQWQFLRKFASRCSDAISKEETAPVLLASFVPTSYGGKYSILASFAFADSITRTEYAADSSASIRMLFLKENVLFLENDDDLIDPRSIQVEASREIDSELSSSEESSISG